MIVWSKVTLSVLAQSPECVHDRIASDGSGTSEIVVSFHPSAIKTLAQEQRGEAV